MWKVHVAHDHEHGYHDSLHSAEVAQLYPQVGDSITRRWLRVSILPIIHFLRCMAKRSPHSFSQLFPARKTSTLRFQCCGSHILQKPPLVPRLGLHHPSPKVRITPSFPSAPNIHETGKIPYQPRALRGSHGYTFHKQVLRITSRHYHNPETVLNQYLCILAPSSNILLLGSPRLTNPINMLTNSHD
jgi:hypothetical protein